MIDFLGRDPGVFIRIIIVTSLCLLEIVISIFHENRCSNAH